MGLLRDFKFVNVLIVLDSCYAIAVNVSLFAVHLVGCGYDGGENLLLKRVFTHKAFFFDESVDFLVRLIAHGGATGDVEYALNDALKSWVAIPSLIVVVAHA